jgi:hypothetical protein
LPSGASTGGLANENGEAPSGAAGFEGSRSDVAMGSGPGEQPLMARAPTRKRRKGKGLIVEGVMAWSSEALKMAIREV